MQNDPMVEWQRLSEVYRGMYDDELLNLAADANDLTETARQVLDAEMKKRGLVLPKSSNATRAAADPMLERRASLRNDREAPSRPTPDAANEDSEYEAANEYTWKTLLCECETTEQAQQLSEVLKQAGIDAWVELAGTGSRYTGFNVEYPRVVVAADQLEQAREIAANPIPDDIANESRETIPEFEAPVCPRCGAADPTLEGVDPFNTWRCEACGNGWTETAEDSRGNAQNEPKTGV